MVVGIVLGLLGTVLAIQLIPYGRDHTNPPIFDEPTSDAPQTRALAKQACFDCHSNETEWSAYSSRATGISSTSCVRRSEAVRILF
jgi:hypothetical protein